MKKFEIGKIMISPTASDVLAENGIDLGTLLKRHQEGDWGDVESHEKLRNEWALKKGGIIRSKYALPDGEILMINTSDDKAATWVILYSEFSNKEVAVQEGYSLWASSYDKENNPLIAVEGSITDRLLSDMLPTTALDIGTGTGRFAIKLAKLGHRVLAIDQNTAMLKVAKRNAQEEKLGIDFQEGIMKALPYKSNHFGLVTCGLALCHVPNLAGVIGEFSRVTKEGGHLLITDFHPDAVAARWRTVFDDVDAVYLLPNIGHTRDDYLQAVESSGYSIKDVFDLYVRDIPEDDKKFFGGWVKDFQDQLFSLIVFAKKNVALG
jgi:ubiquinone/menaquinone biosynthesis C-methylase UbiE